MPTWSRSICWSSQVPTSRIRLPPPVPMADVAIRPATPADVDRIVELVYELAEYEKLVEQCHLTADLLSAALFGDSPALFGWVASAGGEVVGYSLHFLNYSTW